MVEVKELVKGLQIEYDLYHALWPVNPTEIFNDVTEEDWVELDKWASVRDSVGDSVWAYVGYLFQGIKTWKYVEHVPGVYPFQSAVNLWHRGFIPVMVDNKWGLYSPKLRRIIYKD